MTKANDDDIDDLALRKKIRNIYILMALTMCMILYLLWSTYADIKKRVELTTHYRLGYTQLYKSFAEFDSCFGNPWFLLTSETHWLKCDLRALRHANQWRQGPIYLRYITERDSAIESAGIPMYPPRFREMPMPPE